MSRARNLGLALITLGFIEVSWVLFCVFGGLVLALVGVADDALRPVMWAGGGAYVVLALANVPIAALHVAAGVQLRRGRGLVLTIASLAASLPAMILALYCSPFEVLVLIYAVVVLADPEVRAELDRP